MPTPPLPDTIVLPRRRYVRAIGPRLRIFLWIVFALGGLLAANTAYLLGVRLLEASRGATYQNYFYQCMFLGHLLLGLLVIVPFIVFGIGHIKNSHDRPQRRAVQIGYALFVVCLVLLFSGLALMRLEPFAINNARARSMLYWAHVATPLLVLWLYVLHRLAGPRIKWKHSARFALATAIVVTLMLFLHSRDPRKWNVAGPAEGEQYFRPSLARTATGNFIPARALMNDRYCMECHKDNYQSWFHSAHHFSSFNNPMYLFSVRETRRVSLKRDGNLKAARWCAGCHDTVPFFSGAFDDPNYDDVRDPTSQSGLTCTTCHAITHINSTRGNADYTIEEPIQYPFAFSENRVLKFVNRQLIKAKPEFHKQTFLKPLHKTAEFCSVCHKVSIPGDLNHYKDFLRGQNHYDTYLLSGVSGYGARSFYYPDKAVTNCAGCHMRPKPSNDFAATAFDLANPGVRSVHDHFFPGANTGLAYLQGDAPAVKTEQAFLTNVTRVDLVGIKEGGTVDSPFTLVRPTIPALQPGKTYLVEIVVRTLKVGHPLTQGTADSNEMWLESKVVSAGAQASPIGLSGGMNTAGIVDPWAYFFNIYMLDRDGNRIDRRNVQDIFTPLYDHQIPPGAARVIHYRLTVPPAQTTPLAIEAKLQYRKFDAHFVQLALGKETPLPVTTMAADRVVFAVVAKPDRRVGVLAHRDAESPITRVGENAQPTTTTSTMVGDSHAPSPIPEWQRWNDYGIGLFLEGGRGNERGELAQAAAAFSEVEKLRRADGPLNLARVYLRQGRLDDAQAAVERATKMSPPPATWTVAWLKGLIHKQNAQLDQAIDDFTGILDRPTAETLSRGFDFSKDYEVIDELAYTLFERSKLERADPARQKQFLIQARDWFEQTLAIDSENLAAHYGLWQIYTQLGDVAKAAEHAVAHDRYRPDDNARDRAVLLARQRDKAADHAAPAVAIYDLTAEQPSDER